MRKKTNPAIHPERSAAFQDDLDHNQNNGASATSASHPNALFGNAKVRTSGDTSETAMQIAIGASESGAVCAPVRKSRDVEDMHPYGRSKALATIAASAFGVALYLTGCGRGPVEVFPPSTVPTVTIELFVNGQIDTSQGDYIIALNNDFDPNTDINNAPDNGSEQPGEPTAIEAYGENPAPFTHWDQAFVFGSNSDEIPFCPIAQPNGFVYCYKAVTVVGGNTVIKFVPITLSPNTYIFVPAGNGGTGSQNAMEITLPLNCFDNGDDQALGSCGPNFSFFPNVTQFYVNLLTLDNTGAFQDQLACIAGQSFTVDISASNAQQLVKPTTCAAPPNSNLQITGGEVIVNIPGASASPSPSPSPSP